MYLSYSGFKTFQDCRRAYYHQYIAKTVPPKPKNCVHTLYGEAVGKLFERFYRDRLWAAKGSLLSGLLGLVRPTLNRILIRETKKGGIFDWGELGLKPGTRSIDEVEKEVSETIPRGLQSIKYHRLLGVEADAEVVLDVDIDGHKIGGRADFIIKRVQPHNDLVIIDGKGSRWRDKYTNDRQLRWYAMLYWLKNGVIPDQVGFLYWRYEPEESMDWSGVTRDELESLKLAVLEAIEEIELAQKELVSIPDKTNPGMLFSAAPGSNCKLCSYLPVCPEGTRTSSDASREKISEKIEEGLEEGFVTV